MEPIRSSTYPTRKGRNPMFLSEEIPILCDPIKEDSRYYPKEKFIIISDKVILNEVEELKSLIHEIRHHYQYTCVSTNNTSEPMLN